MKRLQGAAYHARKKNLVPESYSVTKRGNICLYYKGGYYHYLNDEEKAAFSPEGLKERGFSMKANVTLSGEEVQDILREHLQKKFKDVKSVKLKVGPELRGHGYNEHEVIVFQGAECEVEMD